MEGWMHAYIYLSVHGALVVEAANDTCRFFRHVDRVEVLN